MDFYSVHPRTEPRGRPNPKEGDLWGEPTVGWVMKEYKAGKWIDQ